MLTVESLYGVRRENTGRGIAQLRVPGAAYPPFEWIAVARLRRPGYATLGVFQV